MLLLWSDVCCHGDSMWAWHCTSSDFTAAFLARFFLPSLPRSLPTFSPSPHMPANQSLKQMWSDCRSASFSQHPYNCAREQIKLLCGVEWVGGVGVVLGGDDEARVVVVEGWVGGGVETESLQNSALFHCWGNSRMELSYLFRKYCLSFSDKKEQ